ncbi:hypothetical protein [Caballeronia zhejiangensis]|uniref:Uncharacterized protein n=1 Tax=Caballeronia zhejiangensis TaxID=871203 RepID=A0A656QCT7_9BURK|nr:hypothetical protein [Caballeronia zhejiangensis]KDR25985.1 hypothetical protein BG60_26285 [Caballeronia zhejiangensis]
MAKSKPPRKKYDPRKMQRRIEAKETAFVKRLIRESEAREMTHDDLKRLALAYHGAFATLRLVGGHDAFKDVAAAMLIAEEFARIGIGAEFKPEIDEALKALERLQHRAIGRDGKAGTGRWVLDGDGLKAVGKGMAAYDCQMEVATYGELREAVLVAAEKNDQRWAVDAVNDVLKEAA